jgi:NSS family neurotransmitter:Na+ symporter
MEENFMSRETFSSRLGFLLISAGSAIGLGNIWRFPYITGQFGGATFILIYLVCLVLLGIPVMTMEFSVGRAAQQSTAKAFHALEKPGTKWHTFSYFTIFGNYLLMFFYTVIAGWILLYLFKMGKGDLAGLSPDEVGGVFGSLLESPGTMITWMIIVVVVGFFICALGLVSGVERVGKIMMIILFALVGLMAIRNATLPGGAAGLAFLLKPNLDGIRQHGLWTVLFSAMGQAFFTLSLGIGSMAVFGSYIKKERALMGEAITVTVLDTCAALGAGFVIFPACFAYGINPGAGPGLLFVSLPVVFNNMPLGQLWGTLFFVFLFFAAFSTVLSVFENLIAYLMELFNYSRKKAAIINCAIVIIFALPCALGFNVLSGFNPIKPDWIVLDLEDFILSNNLLPLGALIFTLFCSHKSGWGWDKFRTEANTGIGPQVPAWLKPYISYVLPLIVLIVFIGGYVDIFFK